MASTGKRKETAGDGSKGDVPKHHAGSSRVSHVLCKFYKAGNCAAGDACAFSHELAQGKPVCEYFARGNCRFSHKCALAHLYPGQSMSMDRKNKRAAQQAARDAANPPRKAAPSAASSFVPPTTTSQRGHQPLIDAGAIDDLEFGLPDDFQPGSPLRNVTMIAPSRAERSPISVDPTALIKDVSVRDEKSHDTCESFPSLPKRGRPSDIHAGSSFTNQAVASHPLSSSPGNVRGSSPFGTSPFGMGSANVFLPRSYGSDDSFPAGSPSAAFSPRIAPSEPDGVLEETDGVGSDDDELPAFIPSLLHSEILTPDERQRQRSRQDTLRARDGGLSQSVPTEGYGHSNFQAPKVTGLVSSPPSLAPFPITLGVNANQSAGVGYAAMALPSGRPRPIKGSDPSLNGVGTSSSSTTPALSPPLASLRDVAPHIPGGSLPQGLAAGFSLHFQPAVSTGMTPPREGVLKMAGVGSPSDSMAFSQTWAGKDLASPRTAPSALTQRMTAMATSPSSRLSSPLRTQITDTQTAPMPFGLDM